MKKIGAVSILITILTGLLSWGSAQVLDLSDRVSRIEEREKSLKEHLIEIKSNQHQIRNDIKYLIRKSK